ncbi:hypothetical protein SBBP2_880079 [Burkholderiales bacterium]|nr:hypothetical protein SBBP2_880079 [Burkholderiales bacterium]
MSRSTSGPLLIRPDAIVGIIRLAVSVRQLIFALTLYARDTVFFIATIATPEFVIGKPAVHASHSEIMVGPR